ncbi:MAG: haloalkane dehalogenase [Chloroflexota bacterium]
MDVLRTPDERFAALPEYDFAPNYVDVDGLRMHYVDAGPSDAAPVLMLHGEPSWSYLYRKMIPIVAAAGYRVIAPDLIGFGRSDKPINREDYTYQSHMDWMQGFIEALNLRHIALVCQDWGGLIGLRLVAEHSDRFARVVAANTMLPTGDQSPSEAFLSWQRFSQEVPDFNAGAIVQTATTTDLDPEVIEAYNAPFPDDRYKAGARQFPMLVPITSDDPAVEANRQAWEQLKQWEQPFLTAFSDSDPVTGGGERIFQSLIPGAQNQPHTIIKNGGHFLQEDQGPELAHVVVDFLSQTNY